MAQLRVIIVDDDKARRESIMGLLPEYIDSVAVGGAEKAIDYLKPDADGILPDLVLLNGDDPKNFGLYIFDWMINKSGSDAIASIPVIVLTEDEFSDKCLEFLEIGDVTFYEGDVNDTDLFSVINEAIEESEFLPEPLITSYEETKNIDRLMGHSVKAPSSEGPQRVLVLDMDNRMSNLEAALERGRQRVTDIRDLLDAAQKLKSNGEERRRRGRERDAKKNEEYVKRMSSFLNKARQKNDREEQLMARMKEQMQPKVEHKLTADSLKTDQKVDVYESLDNIKNKAVNNPMSAYYAQGMKRMEERPKSKGRDFGQFSPDKKTVIIVDDDLKTRKLCSLFLTQKYNVLAFESGMKTIDYFVRNRADLLIINPVMNGMSGLATVSSVHMQPGCANIPIIYLVGENYTEPRSNLLGREVVGILNKPIKQGVIAQAVDGYFDSRGRLF